MQTPAAEQVESPAEVEEDDDEAEKVEKTGQVEQRAATLHATTDCHTGVGAQCKAEDEGKQPESSTVRVGVEQAETHYVLGFVCHVGDSPDDVRRRLINCSKKKVNVQELAAEVLLKGDKDAPRLFDLRDENTQLSAFAVLGCQEPNELATRFLHALVPKLQERILMGKVCFIATSKSSRDESTSFKHSKEMWENYQKIMDDDSSRFEAWYEERREVKNYKAAAAGQGQPGDVLFIPADPTIDWEWIQPEDCSSYEKIRDKARSIFEQNGSCSKSITVADSSDEEELQSRSRKGVGYIFEQKQLYYSFVRGDRKLVCLTCLPRVMKPETKVLLNERAAQILGQLYGLSVLQGHYLSKNRLCGDAILCMV